jgi:hypothetical protein
MVEESCVLERGIEPIQLLHPFVDGRIVVLDYEI